MSKETHSKKLPNWTLSVPVAFNKMWHWQFMRSLWTPKKLYWNSIDLNVTETANAKIKRPVDCLFWLAFVLHNKMSEWDRCVLKSKEWKKPARNELNFIPKYYYFYDASILLWRVVTSHSISRILFFRAVDSN